MSKRMIVNQVCFIVIFMCMPVMLALYPYNEIAASIVLVIGFIFCIVGGFLLPNKEAE